MLRTYSLAFIVIITLLAPVTFGKQIFEGSKWKATVTPDEDARKAGGLSVSHHVHAETPTPTGQLTPVPPRPQ